MNKQDFRIYNGFGITPSKNYVAAGYDFHIPNITTMEQATKMLDAMIESKRITRDDAAVVIMKIEEYLKNNVFDIEITEPLLYNILHLFVSVDKELYADLYIDEAVNEFCDVYLTFDNNGVPGIRLYGGEHLLINSGIKVALHPETAGIFFNKSGRGNQGWDVRACVVDEDYSGYVHLSLAYTKDYVDTLIYAGDKLSQMVVLPIVKFKETVELDESIYNEVMANSQRGAAGFGSSNEKH